LATNASPEPALVKVTLLLNVPLPYSVPAITTLPKGSTPTAAAR
jgi:hypothetical protein